MTNYSIYFNMNEFTFETYEEEDIISSCSREKFTSKHMKIISLYSTLSLDYYNYELDNLPESLTALYLPRYFNQPINKLPKSLKN